MGEKKSSTGIEPNIAGLLSYLVGWITGLIFFLIEQENEFVQTMREQAAARGIDPSTIANRYVMRRKLSWPS